MNPVSGQVYTELYKRGSPEQLRGAPSRQTRVGQIVFDWRLG